MDLIGSYHASGLTVEAYFPEQATPDVWPLWVVRDGKVIEEFTTRIAVDSVYGMDHQVLVLLETAAEAAIAEVLGRKAHGEFTDEFARAA